MAEAVAGETAGLAGRGAPGSAQRGDAALWWRRPVLPAWAAASRARLGRCALLPCIPPVRAPATMSFPATQYPGDSPSGWSRPHLQPHTAHLPLPHRARTLSHGWESPDTGVGVPHGPTSQPVVPDGHTSRVPGGPLSLVGLSPDQHRDEVPRIGPLHGGGNRGSPGERSEGVSPGRRASWSPATT